MKPKSTLRSFLLAAGSSLLAISSSSGQTTYTWDISAAAGVTGGTGAWNTSNTLWTTDGGATNTSWVNAGAAPFNNAIFGGATGTVTLGGPISIRNLNFTHTTGTYTITGSTLNFTSGTITAAASTATGTPIVASISSNITGSPNINIQPLDGDEQLVLNPVASGSMVIGAVTGDGGNGSERLSLQGGAGSTGTIASTTGPKVLVSGGSWTINGASSGRNHEISAGTLTLNANLNGTLRAVILSGTGTLNYNVASAVSASAATASSTDNGFRITGGTLDQTSGAAINTNASTQSIDLAGTLTFAGSGGANSNLHLGSGAVFLKAGNRQITVTNAATTLTIGGVIQNDNGGARGLTKAGAGTLELRGANSYTGATNVNGGTLILSSTGSTHTSSAVSVAAGTVTGTPVAKLGGTGTVGGNLSLAAESNGGFKNGGVLAPTAAASGTQFKVTGTTTFNTGSLFEWNMSATTPGTDPGVVANSGSYGQLAGTGAISGSNAVFNIVLGGTQSFADTFWNSNKSWDNIFTGAGATNALSSIFSSISGAGLTWADNKAAFGNINPGGDGGYFTLSGTSTLNWTAVPEPTSALAGLLLGAGLLRRRR